MEEEIWKDVFGYEGYYEVSNLGKVKSLGNKKDRREKVLKCTLDSDGYPKVGLCANLVRKTIKVHQLVAIAFLNHTPDGNKLVIDHVNGIKTDNRIENLRIVTQRFNLAVGIRSDKNRVSSLYAGVCKSRGEKAWRSQIVIKGEKKYLGSFKNELDASAAYQDAIIRMVF